MYGEWPQGGPAGAGAQGCSREPFSWVFRDVVFQDDVFVL